MGATARSTRARPTPGEYSNGTSGEDHSGTDTRLNWWSASCTAAWAIQSCTSCRSYLTSRPYLRQAGPLLILGSRQLRSVLGAIWRIAATCRSEKGLHVLAVP